MRLLGLRGGVALSVVCATTSKLLDLYVVPALHEAMRAFDYPVR